MLSRTSPETSKNVRHRNLSAGTALTTITMINERELAINPIVQESVQHNSQVNIAILTPFRGAGPN